MNQAMMISWHDRKLRKMIEINYEKEGICGRYRYLGLLEAIKD
jgi:hypothetical protein